MATARILTQHVLPCCVYFRAHHSAVLSRVELISPEEAPSLDMEAAYAETQALFPSCTALHIRHIPNRYSETV